MGTRLKDAIEKISVCEYIPKVIVLHVGTNDILDRDAKLIVDDIVKAYDLVKDSDTKFVFSSICPRTDDVKLNLKAQLINAMAASILDLSKNASVLRHDNLYEHGVVNSKLYVDDEGNNDGVHVNKLGSSFIASNTKLAVGRVLNLNITVKRRNFHRKNYDKMRR